MRVNSFCGMLIFMENIFNSVFNLMTRKLDLKRVAVIKWGKNYICCFMYI